MVIDSQTSKRSDLSFSCSVQESHLYELLAVAHLEVQLAEPHQPLYRSEDLLPVLDRRLACLLDQLQQIRVAGYISVCGKSPCFIKSVICSLGSCGFHVCMTKKFGNRECSYYSTWIVS